MQQKKTVEEIKQIYPKITYQLEDGYHWVGFKNKRKGTFLIHGTGASEAEAWQDAYESLTNTGKYDKTVDHHYHKKSEE